MNFRIKTTAMMTTLVVWARIKPQNKVLRADSSKLATLLPGFVAGYAWVLSGEGRGYPLIFGAGSI